MGGGHEVWRGCWCLQLKAGFERRKEKAKTKAKEGGCRKVRGELGLRWPARDGQEEVDRTFSV